jgi:hypothetical protein
MLKKRQLNNSRWIMTLPDERYRSVKWAEGFLQRLASGEIKRVPRAVRDEARSILRHYPGSWDMQRAAALAPGVFQEHMEPLHRMVLEHNQRQLSDPECSYWDPEVSQSHLPKD